MPKGLVGHTAVQLQGDLYVIGGEMANGNVPNEITRLSCSSQNCEWTTINQHLKVDRYRPIAIPVLDTLCVTNQTLD